MRTFLDVDCDACAGHGRRPPDWILCAVCDGMGYVYAPGSPSFGCIDTLAARALGQEVTLGTGHRGRVVGHWAGSRPLTWVRLRDPFTDDESPHATPFPSACGVVLHDGSRRVVKKRVATRVAHRSADTIDPVRNRP